MEVSHSGEVINAKENPIGAIKLCLNASAGCSSKNKSWDWAQYAQIILGDYLNDKDLYEKTDAALRNSNTNFPNASAALEVVKEYEKTLS